MGGEGVTDALCRAGVICTKRIKSATTEGIENTHETLWWG